MFTNVVYIVYINVYRFKNVIKYYDYDFHKGVPIGTPMCLLAHQTLVESGFTYTAYRSIRSV
ncbi:hypothetical protein HanRHA438_Chr12g0550711 [Helianthus annuus]|nr:hypothetical protein HanRHA438_Chr12g0550711 [Helianthus annuus]